MSLESLVRLLEREPSALSHDRMRRLLQGVFITDEERQRYACFRDDRYSRNCVHRDENFEILLLCWKSGQRSLIHDHGGSLGGVKVVQGVLTETLFTTAPNGMIKAVSSSDYGAADIQLEEPATIHQVSNLQESAADAVSIHIYTPPLERMNIYNLDDASLKSVSAQLYNFGSGI